METQQKEPHVLFTCRHMAMNSQPRLWLRLGLRLPLFETWEPFRRLMGRGFGLCFGLGLRPGLNLIHNFGHARWELPSGHYSGFLSSLGHYVTHSGGFFGVLFGLFGSPTDPKWQPATFAPRTRCVGQMSQSMLCQFSVHFKT